MSETKEAQRQAPARGLAALSDRAAENALIGCMIYDNETVGEILDIVGTSEMFFSRENRVVFDAAIGLWNERKVIDLVTLKAELVRRNKLSEIGQTVQTASAHLFEYIEKLGSPDAPAEYAEIVRDRYVVRTIVEACAAVIRRTESGDLDVDLIRNEAEMALFSALAKAERKPVRTLKDLLQDVFVKIQDIHDRKSRLLGIPTGYHELDDMLSGLQNGQLYIVAGRPSMGKTTLGMNIAEQVGLKEGLPVLFFSLEMSAFQIAQSMLCSHARVSAHELRTGRISDEDHQKLLLAAGAYEEARILVDDASDLSALDLRSRARRMKKRENVRLVIVDYLQKLSGREGPRSESRQVEISNISGHLKAMAKELDVPVVAMAQLNRSPEGRDDRKPILSDLRESGAIEQDADVVVLLYREEYYKPETDRKGIAEVLVSKNRTGPTGTVELAFLAKFTRFENLALHA